MSNRKTVLFFSSLLLVACSSGDDATTGAPSVVADVVYTNGKIYTVDKAQPWAEAVAIKDGKFLKVGSADDVAAVAGDGTEVHDLQGGFAMPGSAIRTFIRRC